MQFKQLILRKPGEQVKDTMLKQPDVSKSQAKTIVIL